MALFLDGIDGIQKKIEKNLLQLVRINNAFRQVAVYLFMERDMIFDQSVVVA
ncbi:hypothetical protein [Desulfocastanea catecholica]